MSSDMLEARRSSRPHKVAKVASYSYGEEADAELPPLHKRAKTNSSKSYTERKPHEIKVATVEKRANAMERAEKLRSSLQSGCPSFIRTMVKSHVYTCYWLGIPTQFCSDHLPPNDQKIILENEKGEEYETNFLVRRTGLSGGWRGFALKHKLHDGDAVVFELSEPARFKVYIIRAHDDLEEENDAVVTQSVEDHKVDEKMIESEKSVELEAAPKPQLDGLKKRSRRKPTKPMKSDDGVSESQKLDSIKKVEEDEIDEVILNGAAEATNNEGLWSIWKACNHLVFNNSSTPVEEVIQHALTLLSEYKFAGVTLDDTLRAADDRPHSNTLCIPPPFGFVNINVDGAYVNSCTTAAAIARDHQGGFLVVVRVT